MYSYFTERNYKGNIPYTDLAIERRRADLSVSGVEYEKENFHKSSWERIKISTKSGAESIGRPMGYYSTLNTRRMDIMDREELDNAKNQLSNELCAFFDRSDIFPDKILIVGLGNRLLTPDSVGWEAAKKVKPTLHIMDRDKKLFDRLRCAAIAVCTPDVVAYSGMDAAVTVKGICDIIKPDAVIAIDALAARNMERLGRTIQITNSGISPGSGLGNPSISLSKESLGAPVISIGVPTVIDSRILCPDFCTKNAKNQYDSEPMFVSPKDISEIVAASADIIGCAINQAFGVF